MDDGWPWQPWSWGRHRQHSRRPHVVHQGEPSSKGGALEAGVGGLSLQGLPIRRHSSHSTFRIVKYSENMWKMINHPVITIFVGRINPYKPFPNRWFIKLMIGLSIPFTYSKWWFSIAMLVYQRVPGELSQLMGDGWLISHAEPAPTAPTALTCPHRCLAQV